MTISKLMDMLVEEATHRGQKAAELAQELGIGYVYLTQLVRGKKPASQLSRPKLINAAHYLGIPVAQAYLWADALEPTDFVHTGKYEANTRDVWLCMSKHPEWGGFMPKLAEWKKLDAKIRLALTFAFEQATGITLTQKTEVEKSRKPTRKKTAQR